MDIKENLKSVRQKIKTADIKKINLGKSNFERLPTNKFVEITLSDNDIKQLLGGRISGKNVLKRAKIDYPKYLYGFINKANEMSGATRSSRVGKLHNLFKQRKFRNLGEWKKWYNKKYPNITNESVDIICSVLKQGLCISPKNIKKNRKYIKQFIENLIFNQTYTGLKIQEIILIKVSKIMKEKYRWSTAKEDSSGIDGYVGKIPVSIKPTSCNEKKRAGIKRVNYKINEKENTLSFTFSL